MHRTGSCGRYRCLRGSLPIFGKGSISHTPGEPGGQAQGDGLYHRLMQRLEAGQINAAEDLLFEHLAPPDEAYLKIAVVFCEHLNPLRGSHLQAHGFCRREIHSGLCYAAARYGIAPQYFALCPIEAM